MPNQRSLFAMNGEEPLFETKELDQLDAIATQASNEDREALRVFTTPTKKEG